MLDCKRVGQCVTMYPQPRVRSKRFCAASQCNAPVQAYDTLHPRAQRCVISCFCPAAAQSYNLHWPAPHARHFNRADGLASDAFACLQVTLLFFAGFLFRFDDIPAWWQWYAYLDYLRYAFGAHLINQFGAQQNSEAPATVNGIPIIEYYGFDQYGKWELLGYEFLFFVVLFFVAWAALQFKRLSKR